MTRKKILKIFGIIILILVCAGVGVWSIFYIEKGDNLETHTLKQIKSKSLDGNYTFDTSSPYFSSEISIASSTDTYVNYDVNTSSFAYTGNLSGVAFKDMSTTSLTYVSRDYHQGEAQEGCKIIITFLDDAHVTYNATDESITRDDYVSDCNGYHGAHGRFFDGDIHVKGDKVNLPTLINLGFTEEDRLMFKKIANNNDISVEDFINTTYNAEGATPVAAEKKIVDENRPDALIYSIQSANIYNGMDTCFFSTNGGYCNYGLFMKDKGNYYVITGSNVDVFTYSTTDPLMKNKLPESFKKELEGLENIDVTKVNFMVSKVLTPDKALEIVANLPEVKTWKSLVEKNTEQGRNNVAKIVSGKETNEAYVVHVYEDWSDHIATFNWYYVNKITREVTNGVSR